jgi:hypothetical protein
MAGNTDIIFLFLSPRRFCRASFFVSPDFPRSSAFHPAIPPVRPASRRRDHRHFAICSICYLLPPSSTARRDHRHFAICSIPSFTLSAPRGKSISDFRFPPRRDPSAQMRGGRTRPLRKTALQVPRFKPESVLQ